MNIKNIISNLYNENLLTYFQYVYLLDVTSVSECEFTSYRIDSNDLICSNDELVYTVRIKSGLTRHQKHLLNNCNDTKFNEIFQFFSESYNKGILSFSGSDIHVKHNDKSFDAKLTFKLYDTGYFSNIDIIETSEPQLLKSVILGKKSWGLWLNEWTSGISEGLFTKHEILSEFDKLNIKIPKSLIDDFDNTLYKKHSILIKNINN